MRLKQSRPEIRWWIYAAYGVYPDMKIHSGGMVSIEKGSMQRKSMKQKLNARRSTRFKIVGVDNHMSDILWRM